MKCDFHDLPIRCAVCNLDEGWHDGMIDWKAKPDHEWEPRHQRFDPEEGTFELLPCAEL